MANFNNNLLVNTIVGATLVIAGVVIKNTFEQLGQKDNVPAKVFGIGCFLLGWVWIAAILGSKRRNPWKFYIPCALIFVSVMVMKQMMAQGKSPHMALPIIFAVSWGVLGLCVGEHLKGGLRWAGLAAPVCVLLSMMLSLPWQRQVCVVDGPGMPLFSWGWLVLILLNSLNR